MKNYALVLFAFGALACILSLVLTPIVRELNRRLGMVDKPDPRRINKVPIPRGGGLAVYLAVVITFVCCYVYALSSGGDPHQLLWAKFAIMGGLLVAVGLADDKWSLPPKLKLLGQAVVAFLTWAWLHVGFGLIIPGLPAWLDAIFTVFWIVGAINAFNLIDGLDGLASGLALIATIAMGGSLAFTGHAGGLPLYVIFAGALFGFLRYNYNPASVFLGDSGSMFIGYTLAFMPLANGEPGAFFVSIGIPILAMGVPIFDTSLAIIRRTVRHLLQKRGDGKYRCDEVMQADTDHLHHRILRSVGLSQKKAAWTLYVMALVLAAFGLGSLALDAHRAGLWLIAVTVITVVIVRDIARVELFDATRLLADIAHDRDYRLHRRLRRLGTPIMVFVDLLTLVALSFFVAWIVPKAYSTSEIVTRMLIRVTAVFVGLVLFRTYRTAWSRAVLSNYARLFAGCALGTVVSTVIIYFAPSLTNDSLPVTFVLWMILPFMGLAFLRSIRPMVRDLLYAIDTRMIVGRKDSSRILVYGAGLRYQAYRRELIRRSANNNRVIVGILDDDVLLRHNYIGGIQVRGTINEAPEIVNALNVDTVVIACEVKPEWLRTVKEILAPTGVKIVHFNYSITEF